VGKSVLTRAPLATTLRGQGAGRIAEGRDPAARRKPLTARKINEVVSPTLNEKPPDAASLERTHDGGAGWHRAVVVQAAPTKTFKLSRDPNLVAKVEDIVGLYLNPPDKAWCWRSMKRAKSGPTDRTQPGLPIKKGRCGTMTHDYKRNGTTTLFAALNMLDGNVIGECPATSIANSSASSRPSTNGPGPPSTCSHRRQLCRPQDPAVKRWLKRHSRFHLHFTPTSGSWLNMVEPPRVRARRQWSRRRGDW
jgi:hypothetical protein